MRTLPSLALLAALSVVAQLALVGPARAQPCLKSCPEAADRLAAPAGDQAVGMGLDPLGKLRLGADHAAHQADLGKKGDVSLLAERRRPQEADNECKLDHRRLQWFRHERFHPRPGCL